MSPILGIYASQISGHLWAPSGAYDSIATVTVGAGGTANIEFTSIPSTYTHLQIRFNAQTNRGTYGVDEFRLQVNSDTGNNYARHRLAGTGSSVEANATTSTSYINSQGSIGTTTAGAAFFGGGVIDILDYANTSKYKTFRTLNGADINGTIAGFGGSIGFASGLWQNTNAITSIKMYPDAGTLWTQYSSFALYGIRGN